MEIVVGKQLFHAVQAPMMIAEISVILTPHTEYSVIGREKISNVYDPASARTMIAMIAPAITSCNQWRARTFMASSATSLPISIWERKRECSHIDFFPPIYFRQPIGYNFVTSREDLSLSRLERDVSSSSETTTLAQVVTPPNRW